MIEEKLKMAAEKLPVPQTTFESIVDRVSLKCENQYTQNNDYGFLASKGKLPAVKYGRNKSEHICGSKH